MNPPAQDHPKAESLAAFGRGKLGEAEFAVVARHLEECAACRLVVEKPTDEDPAAKARREDDPATLDYVAIDEQPGAEATLGPDAGLQLPSELAKHPRYAFLKRLGRGGMGSVYLARDRELERDVAIKVPSPELLERGEALERFKQEARSAAKLPPHPNVVQVYNLEQAGRWQLIVMERVVGVDLEKYVRTKGVLPVAAACHFLRQTALGLQHAFEHGMVHRDVKPNNLMINQKAQLKILDFGLAKPPTVAKGQPGLTGDHVIMGTADYMAPEQALSARDVDIRADLYSLGCTAYFLLAGRPPFIDPEGRSVGILLAHQTESPPPLHDLNPDVPPELSAVIARLLAKQPQDRFRKPVELAQALLPFIKRPDNAPPAAKTMQPGADAPPRDVVTPSPVSIEEDTKKTAEARSPAVTPRPLGQATAHARAFTTARPRTVAWKLPDVPWKWLLAGGGGVLLMVLVGVIGRALTNHGEVKIRLSDPSARVAVVVDDELAINDLGRAIRLKPGDHYLIVSGKDFETVRLPFTVNRGEEQELRVKLIRKAAPPAAAARDVRPGEQLPPALARAAAAHRALKEEARAKLQAAFVTAVADVNKREIRPGQKQSLLNALDVEERRFNRDGLIPWSQPMHAATADYLAAIQNADAELEQAFAGYKGPEPADRLKAILTELLDVRVVARWKHEPGNAVNRLLSNGKVNEPDSPHRWSFDGEKLVFHWRNANVRGGYWIDTCTVGVAGARYNGANQRGTKISGTLVVEP